MEAGAEAPVLGSTIDTIRVSAQVEMFKKICQKANRVGDEDWMKTMQECVEDQAILDIAVMCEADLGTIQHLYEAEPDMLTSETLHLACRFGAREGDLSFLARLRPQAVSGESDNYHQTYPISVAMSRGAAEVSESEIQTMVEIWPRCVITPMDFDEKGMSTPLQQCLASGYSNNLLQFMISKIPETFDDFKFGFYHPLEARDFVWIKPVFDRCQGKIDCINLKWKGPNFHDFLGLCFLQNDGIEKMWITLPNKLEGYDEVDQVALSMVDFKRKYLLPNQQNHPKIEELDVCFSHGSYCGILDYLPQWPCLYELRLEVVDQLKSSMAGLCQLLKHGQLKHLYLEASEDALKSRKRKGNSEEVERPLRPLFCALATNQTVESLTIIGIASDDDKRANCELLVEALKQNTKLIKALGFHLLVHGADDKKPKQLEYYLWLNECNRKQAQDGTTTLREFVSLLGAVKSKVLPRGVQKRRAAGVVKYSRSDMIVSIQYGLLLQTVGKWVSSATSRCD